MYWQKCYHILPPNKIILVVVVVKEMFLSPDVDPQFNLLINTRSG